MDPTQFNQWVNWPNKMENGKLSKRPIQPNGQSASVTDSHTWSSFETVVNAAKQNGWGIGFVLTDNDPFIAIDLDHSSLPENAELHNQILADFSETYCEVSPSGKGYHIICIGDWPTDGNRYGSVEIYKSKRYITVSGVDLNA